MKENMIEMFQNSGSLSPKVILLNFLAAFVLGMVIYVSYKYSYSKLAYSARFNASLVLLTIITTLVMCVIGNNIALSLGMVGALSIIRFRTAIKDSRDTAYIFWAVAIGICCGVSDYLIAGVGTLYIFIILLIIGNAQNNVRYLLVVHASRGCSEGINSCIKQFYNGKAIFRADNSNCNHNEVIYLVSSALMKKTKNSSENISDMLYKIEGVERVSLVSQNNEMNS